MHELILKKRLFKGYRITKASLDVSNICIDLKGKSIKIFNGETLYAHTEHQNLFVCDSIAYNVTPGKKKYFIRIANKDEEILVDRSIVKRNSYVFDINGDECEM